MYVVDITRCGNIDENDMLFGNNSMDAKTKVIDYIINYALANCNINIDKNILDQNLDMNSFSLKEFMKSKYKIIIDKDLLIQSLYTNKDRCLFIKFFNKNKDAMPSIYALEKNEEQKASVLLSFLVNDALIDKYQDNIAEYEKYKSKEKIYKYLSNDLKGDIISLYKKEVVLDELLNNNSSLNSIYPNLGDISI